MGDSLLQKISADERGLIAAIVQDATTDQVIGLYYLDDETLVESLHSGRTRLLSHGNSNDSSDPVIDVRANEDGRSITIVVQRDESRPAPQQADARTANSNRLPPANVIIQSQSLTVASQEVSVADIQSMEFALTISQLYALIVERNKSRPEGSYTTYLFNSGADKILKKIAEESGEVIIAAKNKANDQLIAELSDLFYHLLVLMVERGVGFADVGSELSRRAAARTGGAKS